MYLFPSHDHGGSSWKLYKKDNHPIVRRHKKENRISFLQSTLSTNTKGETVSSTKIQSRIESPVISKYAPVQFSMLITDPKSKETEDMDFEQTYINDLVKFSDKIPGENSFDLNNGQYFREVANYGETESTYGSIRQMVNRQFSDDVNPVLSTKLVLTKETFWPKQQYTYLSDHRQRENYVNDFWRDSSETRVELGS